jgi:hypothetical protein
MKRVKTERERKKKAREGGKEGEREKEKKKEGLFMIYNDECRLLTDLIDI